MEDRNMLTKDYLKTWEDMGLVLNIQGPGNIDLDTIEYNLQMKNKYGLPFLFERDQIKSGSFISKQYEDCLILKNAEHPTGYFYFIFTVRNLGNAYHCSIYRYGFSENTKQQNKHDERINSLANPFKMVRGVLTKVDSQGMEYEYDYYSLVIQTIKEMFGV